MRFYGYNNASYSQVHLLVTKIYMSKNKSDEIDSSNDDSSVAVRFADLNLNPQVLHNVQSLGYEQPTPIQAAIIPFVLNGQDVIGQAQTGTGKTAAFALPILSKIDGSNREVQALILTPTRELAIQVSTAFDSYADNMKGVQVMPIYGGQSYDVQLRKLRSGVQVVIGTPGRIMDHLRRGTLKLDSLKSLVLDEADEMLRMGFIDDVEWILEKTPQNRQVALFSATMPAEIKRIANRYLNNPEHVAIKSKTTTASTIEQYFWMLKASQKMNALWRMISFDLTAEDNANAIVFVRTKVATTEVTDFLKAKGVSCEALSGDVQQSTREKIISRARKGHIKVLVATDVAARGLDIDNITHVINYDIPFDAETYVHRIGRTGRAGRSGKAILFITSKESRMLNTIERTTKQVIRKFDMPTVEQVNEKRVLDFVNSIGEKVEAGVDKKYLAIAEEALASTEGPLTDIDPGKLVAALIEMYHEKESLLVSADDGADFSEKFSRDDRSNSRGSSRGSRNEERGGGRGRELDENMERFRIEVGRNQNVQPGNIVGAIANEVGIDAKHIGHIKLYDDFSTVDLPSGMPKEVFEHLKKVRVSGLPMKIAPFDENAPQPRSSRNNSGGKRSGGGDRKFSGDRRGGDRRGGGDRNSGGDRSPRKRS